MTHKSTRFLTFFLLAFFSTYAVFAYAKNPAHANDRWLDWQESEVASFPEFDLKKSTQVNVDPQSQLRWYVDPSTISLGKDRIVRYVVLGVSKSGTVNASYEGVFCKDGTYKIYGRAIGKTDQTLFEWRAVEKPQWQNLQDAPPHSHTRVLAKTVMCDGNSSPIDVNVVLQRLKNPYQD